MITIRPDWHVVIGLAVTVVLGFGVGPFVRCVSRSLPIEPHRPELEPYWDKLRKMATAGRYIGLVEQPIFFASLWITSGWPIITSWLLFKLAFYWQGANFTSYPVEPPNAEQAAYIVAKRQMGTHHVAAALVGTGANIVAALVGVAVGKWVTVG